MATTTWVRMPLGQATVGPDVWQNATIRNIKSARQTVLNCKKSIARGRCLDEVPSFRCEITKISNDKIHNYTREVRKVAYKLREELVKINESIKKLIKSKTQLDEELSKVRKDLVVNNHNVYTRKARPNREKTADMADQLLKNERSLLLKLKKEVETGILQTKNQLSINSDVRNRINESLRERSAVLKLVSAAVSFPKTTGRPKTAPVSTYRYPNRPAVQEISLDQMEVSPTGALTPEIVESLNSSNSFISNTTSLIRQNSQLIDRVRTEKTIVHYSVNNAINKKIAETVTLTQNLEAAKTKTRDAINRSLRHKNMTSLAKGYLIGPTSYRWVQTKERLDRPLVCVYQGHLGKEVPEARHLIKATNSLDEAISDAGKHIDQLQINKKLLNLDIADKKAAAFLDSAMLRMRNKRKNYKWVMENKFHERRQPKQEI